MTLPQFWNVVTDEGGDGGLGVVLSLPELMQRLGMVVVGVVGREGGGEGTEGLIS